MKLLFLPLVLAWILAGNVRSAEGPAAEIEAKDDAQPTAYRVKLRFGRDVPRSKVSKRMFVLRDAAAGQNIDIVAVRQLGAVEANQPDQPVSGVVIYAKLEPARAYLVEVSFPDGELLRVQVPALKPDNAPPSPSIQPLLNLHARFLDVQVAPFAADGSKGIGLDYDVRYNVRTFQPGGSRLRLELQSHGEVSLTSEKDTATAIQNSLDGGLNVSYLHNVPGAIPLGDEVRTYSYPMGFKVAPAEFELNKDAELVDYTAKFLAGGAIPYLDYPSLLWSKWFNLDVPFFPPTLFTGVAYMKNVKNDGSDPLDRLGHARWDTEFLYDLPLHERLDFRFSWRWYVGLEESFWKNSVEGGVLLYLDDKRTHGLTLSYQRGALPPEFLHTASWRIGYTARF